MAKRPRFEELNEYPEPPDPNGGTKWIPLAVILAVLVGALYVGTHYWYGCSDWGLIKFCEITKKPL